MCSGVHWGEEESREWLTAGRWSFFLAEAHGLFGTELFITSFFSFCSQPLFLFLFWNKLLIFHSFTWSQGKSCHRTLYRSSGNQTGNPWCISAAGPAPAQPGWCKRQMGTSDNQTRAPLINQENIIFPLSQSVSIKNALFDTAGFFRAEAV